MDKFAALFDLHWGYERRNGHKTALHDLRALNCALEFIHDFKPDHIILGGDMLDCGVISHHNHGKPGAVEGLRLLSDAKELRGALIEPLEGLKTKSLTYIIGNHEDWLNDLSDKIPGLEEMLDLREVVGLGAKWRVVPQGEAHRLDKLIFIHGDQIKGGENAAKLATTAYEANVRFGHYHTYQAYTKTSSIESNGHTGIAVPCLCKKGPKYGQGAPNKWVQGFLWGYSEKNHFTDYITTIIDGKAWINGTKYGG